ncbi:SAM-dependent methyltransferase [Actinokineospora globicatena]|uniref:Methyltransferase type 11 n=1 Tax=Actinokineospora globicatena TaxID=103729 RepID=A0A9W6QI56_9PSEU|nr:class I SAM-dependent methyltransferase [Actinokineospora globicatena]GLW89892.1 methyltransferase type 11 [Actinokineospora globicatena]
MRSGSVPTPLQVGRMYDLVTPLLTAVAGGPCGIHHGYWEDDGRSPLADAVDRLTDLVAGRTPLAPGTRVLDVGCGTGQPALRIAGGADVQVTGITVSESQVAMAAARARELGLAHRVRFALVDAMALPYPDNAFDAAWAMQSLLEMTEPERAIGEVFRVLEPGGVLVVADVVTRAPGDGESVAGDMWPTGLRVCTAGQLVDSLASAGFLIDACEDVSPGTRYFMPSYARALAERGREIADAYGPGVAAWAAAVGDYEDYAEDMGYALVTARKPAG